MRRPGWPSSASRSCASRSSASSRTTGRLTAIELTGRPPLERDALFFHVGLVPRTALAASLGCELADGGYVIAADEDRQTSVDRVYAVGNCVDPWHNVALAIADGARAALAINVRLVGEGVLQPRAGAGSRAPIGCARRRRRTAPCKL